MSALPTVFLSHGAPPLADDPTWPGQLAAWGADLTRPSRILVVSAHWEDAPVTLGASRAAVPVVHDFWGFPQRYFDVQYPAPTAPELADEVTTLLEARGAAVRRDESRGLDHGAYVPLVEMFPEADVPVLQMSLPTLDPGELLRLGQALAPLRAEGTLVMGSGFTTHNLGWFDPRRPADAEPPAASAEFDAWAQDALDHGDVDALLDFAHRAPAARTAHPRTEHWAPLYVALGAAGEGAPARSVIDGFWYGLSKRSWQIGDAA